MRLLKIAQIATAMAACYAGSASAYIISTTTTGSSGGNPSQPTYQTTIATPKIAANDPGTTSFTIKWKLPAGTATSGGTPNPDLTAEALFDVTTFNGSTLAFDITIKNTTVLPPGNFNTNVLSFGFNIDPNATGVTVNDVAGSSLAATTWEGALAQTFPAFQTIDVCVWAANGCTGGNVNLGLAAGATDKLTLNLSASFIDPKFSDETLSFRFNGRCDDVVCPRSTSVGGNTLPRTPKTQLSGGAEWNSTFGNDFEFFLRGDVTYQSEMQIDEMNIGQIEPRTLVNARIGIAKEGWSADLWGRNIFDERYVANSFFIISGVSYGTALGEQATYGATMRYRF